MTGGAAITLRLLAAIAIGSIAGGCALSSRPVVRLSGTREIQGRYIAPEAYEAFALGVIHEHRGELERARQAYTAALDEDPESPEILTRLAAIDCRTTEQPVATLFARLLERHPAFGPGHLETARCSLARGQTEAALEHASVAIALEPTNPQASELMATILERRGNATKAELWRRAWTLYRPLPDVVVEERARARPVTKADVAAALSRGDLRAARRLAVAARLPSGELSALAATLGRPELAREQATLVLGADPDDADAWIARLVAAELERDDQAFRKALGEAPDTAESMSPTGEALMAALLERRIGPAAREAWNAACQPPEPEAPDEDGAEAGAP